MHPSLQALARWLREGGLCTPLAPGSQRGLLSGPSLKLPFTPGPWQAAWEAQGWVAGHD